MKNLYDVLEIKSNASQEVIEITYQKLKRNAQVIGRDATKYDDAFSILGNEASRRAYDRGLGNTDSSWENTDKYEQAVSATHGNIGFLRYLNQTTWWWIPITIASFFIFCAEDFFQTFSVLVVFFAPWLAIKLWIWNEKKETYVDRRPLALPINLKMLGVALFLSMFLAYFVVHFGNIDSETYMRAGVEMAKQYDIHGSDSDIRGFLTLAPRPDRLFLTLTGFITFIFLSLVYWWRNYLMLRSLLIRPTCNNTKGITKKTEDPEKPDPAYWKDW